MTLPRTPSFRLDGRRALVAGASSGIGAAATVALAEQGAEVTLCARREPELQALAMELQTGGMWAEILPLDITDVAAVEGALAHRPAFDVLVNSAGFAKHSPAIETRIEDFDLVTGLNFRAAYFLTRSIAKRLIDEGKPGSLINISSQMAHVGGIDRAVYSATKHAVEGMTKSMANPHRADRRHLRQPRTRPMDCVEDQARPGGRGRRHHGGRGLPCLGCRRADYGNFACRRWRLDRRLT